RSAGRRLCPRERERRGRRWKPGDSSVGTIQHSEMQFFTEEEVNAALEAVRPLAERLVAARRRLAHVSERLERVRGHVAGKGGGLDPERVRGLHEQAAETAGDIAAVISEPALLGVQINDLDTGLMAFP